MNHDDDAEIIAAARVGFLDEAADMLAQFEQSLLVMETEPDDAENLNAAFRAAHTIKGTAGLFGCDAVVSFTHEVETLLEALRSGVLSVNDDITAGLLEGLDQMAALLDEVRTGKSEAAVAERSRTLGLRLQGLRGAAPGGHPPAADSHVAGQPTAAAGGPASPGSARWMLAIRFSEDALRNGLDPLAFLRYLATLGPVEACRLRTADIPRLEDLDPEGCHLGFDVCLRTDRSRADIEQVFEFAIDDCDLKIDGPQHDAGAPSADAVGAPSDGRRAANRADAPASEGPATRTPDADAPGATATAPAEDRRVATRDRRAGDEVRYVKVRADKLDHLIDLIGELVIAGSGAQMAAEQEGAALLLEATERVGDLVQSTRDAALALRMVPVGETFSRFQRVVRDVSKQLGKSIDLVLTGGDTELDKSMVDVIVDPLMHLVRNSLDHGLEAPEERQAAGKPPTGRLALHAYHEGGSIVIEVSDDGRGLHRERILAKAVQRGLVDADAALTDPEVWNLIFAPGFSTKDQVTDLSGRGVGMDVVRRNIESLRGHISLASTEGRGTTIQIRLPLTLAMIDGFLALAGGVHYVMPLAVVSECIDLPAECRQAPDQVTGTFDLRGEVVPYLDLALFYGVAHGSAPAAVQAATGRAKAPRRSLIVVRDGPVRIGVVVDRLLGEHQTVIKPLAGIFCHLKALAGSTILGSGDVALVLDIQGLLAAAMRHPGARHPQRAVAAAASPRT